ncbi:hypothetical protein [Parasitella parasitica]|uniref:Uncharacterized protein n=1 Tax=Parasitella parasitica TaxID=35722 RepID=A0A0B7MP66_9FUNG|nr:hypothetical protein [Parasitella parasitica]
MVGGSHFKILIDSGASTNYAHPKLLHYAKSTANVKNQAVETANGQQACIKQVINFDMFLGDDYEFKNNVNAFVFDSKFDIILGNAWLKQVKPSPDWFSDTWTLTHQNGFDTTILKPLNQSQVSPLSNITDYTNQSLSINTENKHNNAILNNATTPCSTFFDIKPEYDFENSQDALLPPNIPTDDYLLSSNQLARLLKKNQISECFVINFISQDSDNTLITPIYPPTFEHSHQFNHLEVTQDNTGELWKQEFEKLFPYAFKDAITELPPHRNTRDIIVTNPTNATPISVPPYRMSPLELKQLRRQLNDLEKKFRQHECSQRERFILRGKFYGPRWGRHSDEIHHPIGNLIKS